MKIDISKILHGKVEVLDFNKEAEIDEVNVNGRYIKLISPVKIDGAVYYTNEGLFLSGNIQYQYVENCARCLKEFKISIQTNMSATITDNEENIEEIEENEEFIIYLKGNIIDINDLVVSSILLSIPMKSLCDEECKGLCPKCGKNLNEGYCDCKIDDIDPRLEKLKKLFD